MFKYKKNKRVSDKTFSSYEEARSFVRKLIRKNNSYTVADCYSYSNPSITDFGYSIFKI